MLRQIKPKNARSKRALAEREPKAVENVKTALFLRGTSCSQAVQDAQNDLAILRSIQVKRFTKKNSVFPFEDPASLEFFSEKNDASILCFGAKSKKRGDTLTFVRTFAHKVYDMLELALDTTTYRPATSFRGKKPATGTRPLLSFNGTAFDAPVADEYTLARSVLTDFFRGDSTPDAVDVEGLQHLISFTVGEASAETEKPPIHMRVYSIRTRRSGNARLPRVEVDEVGPRLDLRVGRVQHPDEAMEKEALRRPRLPNEERVKKNIVTDAIGDKIGRIHLGRQDLGKLQTRKMKGLKRSRDQGSEDEGGASDAEEEKPKGKKKAKA
ncbi:Brix domain-containing protein [Plectosphaerella plurivora]|uniref:Ribosome production factor 2 homolog n=1 Tax=Plectosphaerella plurivora TaxID=936078 RepID=A0A9P9AAA5_9PEZI|nr:Brix domain-containing protein [Plectosphaerella plurivora]